MHRRFDGSRCFPIQGLSLPCQPQQPSTPIAFVRPPAHETAALESLQDGRERTGVQMMTSLTMTVSLWAASESRRDSDVTIKGRWHLRAVTMEL